MTIDNLMWAFVAVSILVGSFAVVYGVRLFLITSKSKTAEPRKTPTKQG